MILNKALLSVNLKKLILQMTGTSYYVYNRLSSKRRFITNIFSLLVCVPSIQMVFKNLLQDLYHYILVIVWLRQYEITMWLFRCNIQSFSYQKNILNDDNTIKGSFICVYELKNILCALRMMNIFGGNIRRTFSEVQESWCKSPPYSWCHRILSLLKEGVADPVPLK